MSANDADSRPQAHLPRAENFLLWPPGLQAWGYRIVDQLFASRTIARGPSPRVLPRGPEIAPVYRADGAPAGVAEFLDRNTVAGLLVMREGRVCVSQTHLTLPKNRGG